MAKKLLSETIDFCLRRWAAPKIHRVVFEGESGDLCRLRSLAKRDELWGVLGSPYLTVPLALAPLPLSFLAPLPLLLLLFFPFPFFPFPLRRCSFNGPSPSGFSSLSSRRRSAFQLVLPLRPLPLLLPPPLPPSLIKLFN